MLRKKRESRRVAERVETRGPEGLPQFSPAFVAEVGGCEDLRAFQDLLERKGLWLNRNAAEGVFTYLQSMGARELNDDDLVAVVGGVGTGFRPDDQLVSTLQILADQISGAR